MWDVSKSLRFQYLRGRELAGNLTEEEQAELAGLIRELEDLEATGLLPASERVDLLARFEEIVGEPLHNAEPTSAPAG